MIQLNILQKSSLAAGEPLLEQMEPWLANGGDIPIIFSHILTVCTVVIMFNQ